MSLLCEFAATNAHTPRSQHTLEKLCDNKNPNKKGRDTAPG